MLLDKKTPKTLVYGLFGVSIFGIGGYPAQQRIKGNTQNKVDVRTVYTRIYFSKICFTKIYLWGAKSVFIGREKEIAILKETYDKPGFQMTVIYGRRRIGKSKLITEFIKGKRASYYVASKNGSLRHGTQGNLS